MNRVQACRNFHNCEDCVSASSLFCKWDLRYHNCFYEDDYWRGNYAEFSSECPSYWGNSSDSSQESASRLGLIFGILFLVAIVVGILVCAARKRRSRRWRNPQQVTTGRVMAVQTQPMPQPRPVMAMPMNSVYPPQHQPQPQPQMGQRMMGQMQYQPNPPQYQSNPNPLQYQPNPPQMAPAPVIQSVPSAPPAFQDDGAEGMGGVCGTTNQ